MFIVYIWQRESKQREEQKMVSGRETIIKDLGLRFHIGKEFLRFQALFAHLFLKRLNKDIIKTFFSKKEEMNMLWRN